MPAISDEVVRQVVTEVSTKMADPDYSAITVGAFVQYQAPATQFVTAHESELGGNAEAIINVIFHAALLALCFQRAAGNRVIRTISYEDLDAVAGGDSLATLAKRQPALSDFIVSNVEHLEAQKLLALLALAMDHVS